MASKKENNGKNNVTARWLLVATTFFALLSFFAIGRIVYLQYFWKPDPRVLKMNDFKLQAQKHHRLRGATACNHDSDLPR